MFSTLLLGSHLGKLGLHGDKWAVSSSGSTVQVVWAAVPVLIWAASSWARCLMFSALLVGSHLGKLCPHGDKWAVSSSGSTVQVVWAAVPVLIWAASSWAGCLMFSALLVGSHLGKRCLHGDKWAVSSSASSHLGSIQLGRMSHVLRTACWQPSWKALSSWRQMGSQQQWQHSTGCLGSSTSSHLGSIQLGRMSHGVHTACWQPSWKALSSWRQ